MGWFSFLGKNKQDTQEPEGAYVARTEEPKGAGRSKRVGKGPHEAVDPVLPEKKRARRRLVGAIALALAVIIGLPMVLDSEPKPLSGDIAIEIPSKDKPYSAGGSKVAPEQSLDPDETLVDMGKPGTGSSTQATQAGTQADTQPSVSAKAPVTPAANRTTPPTTQQATQPATTPAANTLAGGTTKPPVAASPAKSEANLPAKPETNPPAKPETKPETKSDTKPETKPVLKPTPEPKVATKPTPEPRPAKPEAAPENDDAVRAQAILEGKPEPKTEAKPKKYLLQVAALASQEKVDELQGKLRDAGISSHTQKVAVDGGTRIRVRVGPFADKDEALKVRERLARLGLSGALLAQ